MRKHSLLQLVATFVLALCVHSGVYAHSALKSSSPEKGATVSSPSMLMLTFEEAVRLVKVEMTGNAGAVETGFAAKPAANTMFHIPVPALDAGAYEVSWSIIGADGHAVSETFGFNVDPNAPAAVMNHGDQGNGATMQMDHGQGGMNHGQGMNHGHNGMEHGQGMGRGQGGMNHGQGGMNHGQGMNHNQGDDSHQH